MDASESPASRDLPAPLRAKVVYLDQNKWIELAQAAKSPKNYPVARGILEILCAGVEAGSVRLPLTSTNIYETHKVNRREQRWDLAYTQTTLSKGEVFRGFHRRLEVEIGRVLSRIYNLPWTEPAPDWVFSNLFFEATAEAKDPRLGRKISDRVLELMHAEPQRTLFHYLMNIPDPVRQQSIREFTCGFRHKSATHSDLKSAGDSDLKSATCSDGSRPPIPI